MDRAEIDRVRSFDRTMTERIGALSDRYVAREQSLGESRVLWEIGPTGCEVRALRRRLGQAIDSIPCQTVSTRAGPGRNRRPASRIASAAYSEPS